MTSSAEPPTDEGSLSKPADKKALANIRKRRPNQHYSPELFKPIFKLMECAPPHAVPRSAEDVKLALSAYVCDPDIALLALLEGDDEAPSSINRKKLIEDPGGLEQLARQLAHADLAIDAYEPAKVLVETTNSEPPKTLIQQLMQMNAPQLCRTSRERCEDLHELSEDQWGAMIADGRVRINGTECKEPDRLLDRPGELIEFLGSTTGDLLDAIAAQVVEPAKRIAQAAERRSSHAAYHEGDEAIRSESADLARRIADWLSANEKATVSNITMHDFVALQPGEVHDWTALVETVRKGGRQTSVADWAVLAAAVEVLERPALVYSAKYNVSMRFLPSSFTRLPGLHIHPPAKFEPAGHLEPNESWLRFGLLEGSHFIPIKSATLVIDDILAMLDFAQMKMDQAEMDTVMKHAVMVVGGSGAGKSTLMHVLMGIPLEMVTGASGKKSLVPADASRMLPGSKIGGTLKSETKHVNVLQCRNDYAKDDFRAFAIIDTPGFGDLSGPEDDVVNAVSISKTMSLCDSLRIIFLFSGPSLYGDRGGAFRDNFQTLARLFKDFRDVSKHVLLWGSQLAEYTESQVKARFSEVQVAQNDAHRSVFDELCNISRRCGITFVNFETGMEGEETQKIVFSLVDKSDFASQKLLEELRQLHDVSDGCLQLKLEDYAPPGASDDELDPVEAFLIGQTNSVATLMEKIGATATARRKLSKDLEAEFMLSKAQVAECVELLSKALTPEPSTGDSSRGIPVNFNREDLLSTISSRAALKEPRKHCNMPLSASSERFFNICCKELKSLAESKCAAHDFKAVARCLDTFNRLIKHFESNDKHRQLHDEMGESRRSINRCLKKEVSEAADAFLSELCIEEWKYASYINEAVLQSFLRAVRLSKAAADALRSPEVMEGVDTEDTLLEKLTKAVQELVDGAQKLPLDDATLRSALVKLQHLRKRFDAIASIGRCATDLEEFILQSARQMLARIATSINAQDPDDVSMQLSLLERAEAQLKELVPSLKGFYATGVQGVINRLDATAKRIERLVLSRDPACISFPSTAPKAPQRQGSADRVIEMQATGQDVGAAPATALPAHSLEHEVNFLHTFCLSLKLLEHFPEHMHQASVDQNAAVVDERLASLTPASGSPLAIHQKACETILTWHEEVTKAIKEDLIDLEGFKTHIGDQRARVETLIKLNSLPLCQTVAKTCVDQFSTVHGLIHQMLCAFTEKAKEAVEDLENSKKDYSYQNAIIEVLLSVLWWDKLADDGVDRVLNSVKILWNKYRERAGYLARMAPEALQQAEKSSDNSAERTRYFKAAKTYLEQLHAMSPLWEMRLGQSDGALEAKFGISEAKFAVDACKDLKRLHDEAVGSACTSLSRYILQVKKEEIKDGKPFCSAKQPRVNEEVKNALRSIDALLDLVEQFKSLDWLELAEMKQAKSEGLSAVEDAFKAMSTRVTDVFKEMTNAAEDLPALEEKIELAPPEEAARVLQLFASEAQYPALFHAMATKDSAMPHFEELRKKLVRESRVLGTRFPGFGNRQYASVISRTIMQLADRLPEREPYVAVQNTLCQQAETFEAMTVEGISKEAKHLNTSLASGNFDEVDDMRKSLLSLRTVKPTDYKRCCESLTKSLNAIVRSLYAAMDRMKDHINNERNGFLVEDHMTVPFNKLSEARELAECIKDLAAEKGGYPLQKMPPSTNEDHDAYQAAMKAGGFPVTDERAVQPEQAELEFIAVTASAEPISGALAGVALGEAAILDSSSQIAVPGNVLKGKQGTLLDLDAELAHLLKTFDHEFAAMVRPIQGDFEDMHYQEATQQFMRVSSIGKLLPMDLSNMARRITMKYDSMRLAHLNALKEIGKTKDVYVVGEVLHFATTEPKMEGGSGIDWFNRQHARLEALYAASREPSDLKRLFEEAFDAIAEAVKKAVKSTFDWANQKHVKGALPLELLRDTVQQNFCSDGGEAANYIRRNLELTPVLQSAAKDLIAQIHKDGEMKQQNFELLTAKQKATYIHNQMLPACKERTELLEKYRSGFETTVKRALQLLKEHTDDGQLSKLVLEVRSYVANDGFTAVGGKASGIDKAINSTHVADEMEGLFSEHAEFLYHTLLTKIGPDDLHEAGSQPFEDELLADMSKYVDVMRVASTASAAAHELGFTNAEVDKSPDNEVMLERMKRGNVTSALSGQPGSKDIEICECGRQVVDKLLQQYQLLKRLYLGELKMKGDCGEKKHALEVLFVRDSRPFKVGLTSRVVELEALTSMVATTQPPLQFKELADTLSSHQERDHNTERMLKADIAALEAEIEQQYDQNADPEPLDALKYDILFSKDALDLIKKFRTNDVEQELDKLRGVIRAKVSESFKAFQKAMRECAFEKAAEENAYLEHVGALLELEAFSFLKARKENRDEVFKEGISSIVAAASSEIYHPTVIPPSAKNVAQYLLQLRYLEEQIPSTSQHVADTSRELLNLVKTVFDKRSNGTDIIGSELLELDPVCGKAVIEQFLQVFVSISIRIYNDKPKIDLQDAVDGIKGAIWDGKGRVSHPQQLPAQVLLFQYKRFLEYYDGVLSQPALSGEWIKSVDASLLEKSPRDGILTEVLKTPGGYANALDKIKTKIRRYAQKRRAGPAWVNRKASNLMADAASWMGGSGLSTRDRDAVPEVLAGIFAYWAFELFLKSYDPAQPFDSVPLRKPNVTQVLCILRLLGSATKGRSTSNDTLINHLAQVPTGEGKSIVIAATAATLALFGYQVDCACFSDSLSQRDYQAFKPLFEGLEVSEQITYGTFENLAETLIKQNHGDVREQVIDYLKTGKHAPPKRQDAGEKVLVIDEVDTFLSPTLFGAPYSVSAQLSHKTIAALQRAIWAEPTAAKGYPQEVAAVIAAKVIREEHRWIIESAVRQMQAAVLAHRKKKPVSGLDYEVGKEENKGWIAYKVHDRFLRSDKYSHRYGTNCTYLEEALVAKTIDEADLDEHGLPMHLQCGEFAYSLMPSTKPYSGESGLPAVPPFYMHVLGVTGTLDHEKLPPGSHEILASEFDIKRLTLLPSMYPQGLQGTSNRSWAPGADTKLVTSLKTHHLEIANETLSKLGTAQTKRAVLIFFESRSALLRFYDSDPCKKHLRDPLGRNAVRCLTEVLANDTAREREKESAIRKATTRGQVTLCTRDYGRGVDFRVNDEAVLASGGVHVLATFFSDDVSEEVQLMGRCARQGDKGSFSMVLNTEDLDKFGSDCVDAEKLKKWDGDRKVYDELHKLRTLRGMVEKDERIKMAHEVKLTHQNVVHTLNDPQKFFEFVKRHNDAPKQVSSRTIIAIDLTSSMAHLLNMTKNQIREFFKRISTVLAEQNISQGFEMQIVGYRNYNAPIEDLLEASPWATVPESLQSKLDELEVKYGWGDEAVEAAFLHVETEVSQKPVSQVILIGDAPAQSIEDAQYKRSQQHGEEYWAKQAPSWSPTGLRQPTCATEVIQRIQRSGRRTKVHAYYIDKRAADSFEKLAIMTGGTHGFLNIRERGGAEMLTGLICTQILEVVGGQKARDAYEHMFGKPSFS